VECESFSPVSSNLAISILDSESSALLSSSKKIALPPMEVPVRIVWLILKVITMLLVISVCYADIRDMAWVRGATGNTAPLIWTLVGAAVILFWAYTVVWSPIKPEKLEKK
jgi:hypothetical protein